MSFYVHQTGSKGVWIESSFDSAKYLGELFGLNLSTIVRLYGQIDELRVGKHLDHVDLGVCVTKYDEILGEDNAKRKE